MKKLLFVSALLTAGDVLAEIKGRELKREAKTCNSIASILFPKVPQTAGIIYAMRNREAV